MRNYYENIPSNQIEKQKKYFYGAILDVLYKFEADYPFLDNRLQNLINQVKGSNELFGKQPQVLTIVALLQTAKDDRSQLRSCVLSAINLVDTLEGGDSDVRTL
jgi:hypothetical protein